MRFVSAAIGVFAAAISVSAPAATSCRNPIPIRFASGANGATVSASLIRGDRACYTFVARKGQRLDTTLNDEPDENVFLMAYEPGYGLTRDDVGVELFTGTSLPGLSNESGNKEAHVEGSENPTFSTPSEL